MVIQQYSCYITCKTIKYQLLSFYDSKQPANILLLHICTRVARFLQQNPPNCYSKLAQLHFEGGSPVKIAFQGVKYTFFGRDPPVKIAFQGVKYTFFGRDPPVKIAFQGVKYTFFGGDPPVKFAFQGLNITFLGSLHEKQPAATVLK